MYDKDMLEQLEKRPLVEVAREIPEDMMKFFPYYERITTGIIAKDDGWEDCVREVLKFVGVNFFTPGPTSTHAIQILEQIADEISPEVKRFIYGALRDLQPSEDKPHLEDERANLLVQFVANEEQGNAMILDNLQSSDYQLKMSGARSVYNTVSDLCSQSAPKSQVKEFIDPLVLPLLQIIGDSITAGADDLQQYPYSAPNLAISTFSTLLEFDPELAIELIADKFSGGTYLTATTLAEKIAEMENEIVEVIPSVEKVPVYREDDQYTNQAQGGLALLGQSFPKKNREYRDHLAKRITEIGDDGSVRINPVVQDAVRIIGPEMIEPILRSVQECMDLMVVVPHFSSLANFGTKIFEPILKFMDEGDYRDKVIGTQALYQYFSRNKLLDDEVVNRVELLSDLDQDKADILLDTVIGEAESNGDEKLLGRAKELKRALSV